MTWFVPALDQLKSIFSPDHDEEWLREGRLSKNFWLREFTRSATARRHGINNEPGPEEIRALNALVDNVLQPARDALGVPINVSSGYRSPKLNRAVKGSRNSDHMYGRAADIETRPETQTLMWQLGQFIQSELEFKQLIWEFGGEWIHVSYDPDGDNRGDVRQAYVSGKRVIYPKFSFLS